MNLLGEVTIHSISYNNGDRNFTFKVGQTVGIGSPKVSHKICLIARDESHREETGDVVYKVFVETEDGNKLWRYVENKPVDVICDI